MQKAVNSLRNAQKSVALGHLKLKRQLEDILIKALESLHTLEGTLINVEGAAGNIRVSHLSASVRWGLIVSVQDHEILRVLRCDFEDDFVTSFASAR